ncbi:hypothetical protein Ciccas_000549 [Cichlidogyrus casuarinus]|uniref:Aryl hydrocarbon receptor nuclear translocator n=1 Tax=Cichlidogyrus casuarinus TaxID=1844966 RepID=A0ABD2QMN5_9PLAT
MTAYINELCEMVPTCSSLARKPDKLTILRMAVSHMKSLRGSGNTGTDGSYRPSFLSDQELKYLILEAADGFLFVCQCDTGRIVYVSDSVTAVLSQSQSDWYQQTIYDVCHPDDAEKIKEQLTGTMTPANGASASSITNTAPTPKSSPHHKQQPSPSAFCPLTSPNTSMRILDLKTGTVKKEGCQGQSRMGMGSRRGFICRMRLGSCDPPAFRSSSASPISTSYNARMARITQRAMLSVNSSNPSNSPVDQNGVNNNGPQYVLVHVTGIIKNWPLNTQQQSNQSNPNYNSQPGYSSSSIDPFLQNSIEGEEFASNAPTSTPCLVALGRLQICNMPTPNDLTPQSRPCSFVLRINASDGLVTFCDQRISQVWTIKHTDQNEDQHLPEYSVKASEILGQTLSEFIPDPEECLAYKEVLEKVVANKIENDLACVASLRVMKGSPEMTEARCHVRLSLHAFLNPYNQEIEYVICTVTTMRSLQDSSMLAAVTAPQSSLQRHLMAMENNVQGEHSLFTAGSTFMPNAGTETGSSSENPTYNSASSAYFQSPNSTSQTSNFDHSTSSWSEPNQLYRSMGAWKGEESTAPSYIPVRSLQSYTANVIEQRSTNQKDTKDQKKASRTPGDKSVRRPSAICFLPPEASSEGGRIMGNYQEESMYPGGYQQQTGSWCANSSDYSSLTMLQPGGQAYPDYLQGTGETERQFYGEGSTFSGPGYADSQPSGYNASHHFMQVARPEPIARQSTESTTDMYANSGHSN